MGGTLVVVQCWRQPGTRQLARSMRRARWNRQLARRLAREFHAPAQLHATASAC